MSLLGKQTLFTALLLALGISGCGNESLGPGEQRHPDTSCGTGMAEIVVYDNFLQRSCGCSEAAGLVPAGTALNCTVPSGTTVIFFYGGVSVRHEILSTGAPSFAASPIFDPSLPTQTIHVHTVTLTASGTYQFVDAFDSSLSGRIIVP